MVTKQSLVYPFVLFALLLLVSFGSTPIRAASTPDRAADSKATETGPGTGWTHKRAVTISNAGTTLSNYQVRVSINAANFDFSYAQPDGRDLRFYDEDDSTLLNYWIENYSQSAQTGTIWVKVPSIPAGSKNIYLYYGNPNATKASDGNATFDFFDDFDSSATTSLGFYHLSSAQTVMVQSGFETSAPHTLSVVPAPSGDPYKYWGYYGPQNDGWIGRARSNDLMNWEKDSTALISGDCVRWPSVLQVGTIYYMVHTKNYCGSSEIGWRSSTDGLTWTDYQQLVSPGGGGRDQNPNLFLNPNDNKFYLYWYSNRFGGWSIMARTAASVAELATAPNITVLQSSSTLAAPNMMYRDGTYFLATEIVDSQGHWNIQMYSSTLPTSGFTLLPDGNPLLSDGAACGFQTPIDTTLYLYYCKQNSSTGVWTEDLRTADLTQSRQSYPFGVIDSVKWTGTGGAWTAPSLTQQDGLTGIVAQGVTSSRQVLYSSFSGSDYIVEGYGKQVGGRVWGMGVRVADGGNLYSVNLYEDLDGTNNLYIYRWTDGGAITVRNAAVGAINPNSWYKITVKVHGTLIDVYIDDVPKIVGATDSQFSSGKIALYGEGGTTAQFNDVRVRQYAATEPISTVGSDLPTAAEVVSFVAKWRASAVQVKWTTGSELALVGFNLWRSEGKNEYQKLNSQLIPAQNPGGITSAKYQYHDAAVTAGKTYNYKLQVLHLNASTDWTDSVRVQIPSNCATRPETPNLLSPANNAEIHALPILLDWKEVGCTANYQLQIARKGPGWNTVIDAKNLPHSKYMLEQLPKPRRDGFYWRVRACNQTGCSDWSQKRYFLFK